MTPIRIRGAAGLALLLVLVVVVVVVGVWVVRGSRTGTTPVGVVAPAQTLTDLPYATASGAEKLDLFLPARHGVAIPLIIKIHGGAWFGGDKTDDLAYLKGKALDRGWALASINYRLTGEARFPAALQDVRQATRWLKENAAGYGLDPGRFASWGESSGGYFAEELAVTGDQNSAVLDDPALGDTGTGTAVAAAVSMYGVSDLKTLDAQAPRGCGTDSNAPDSVDSRWLGAPLQSSPELPASILENYVPTARTLAPLYLAHGTADCDVPYGQSAEMKAAYDKAGAVVQLHPFPGLGHDDQRILDGSVDGALTFVATAFGA
jgi:acetyl esterase/lipase